MPYDFFAHLNAMKTSLAPAAETYLFVPANRPERYEKAMASGADVVIVDFEDAVAPEQKASARTAFVDWANTREASDAASPQIAVRLNDALSTHYLDDVAAAISARVSVVMLPKCEHASQIDALRDAVGADVEIIALVESARGVQNIREIAEASGTSRIAFGSIDFAVDLDVDSTAALLDHVSVDIALASRAAGISPPIAGVTVAIDAAAVEADMRAARGLGFGGKLCIHPKQIEGVRAALRPCEDEILWARRVLDATASSAGAVRVDGEMVDRPVVLKAQRILQRL